MANYRYLGYGITNEQGIATLDHDANGDPLTHSYTGTGAGEIDIVASLDDNTHISERSIQSETYSILDASVLDRAKSGTSGVDYVDLFGNMGGVTRGDSDSTVIVDRSSSSSANNKSTSSYNLNDGLSVSVELTEVTNIGYVRVSLTGTTNSTRGITPTAPCVIRFECKPTSTKIYKDDVLVLEETEDNITALVFQFRTLANTIDNFKYKNLAIYPI